MNELNNKNFSQNESTRLRELIREIGIPLRRLQDIIKMKPEDCMNWWSNVNPDLKVGNESFSRIKEMVAIDENELFLGTYDRELARSRLHGNYQSLPEKYQENQNSFLRTSAHIVRYIILTRGQHFADQVLYSMNVSPLIYQHLGSQKINLTYFADLLEMLSKRGFRQEELDTLASVIFLSLQETTLGKNLGKSENVHDIYSTLAQNFDYFDSNFEYKSRFIGKKYVLTTTLDLTQHEDLKETPENTRRLMRYRHILLAWFPYLAGLAPVFPKTDLLRFNQVVEMQYEFDLTSKPKPPKRLYVV